MKKIYIITLFVICLMLFGCGEHESINEHEHNFNQKVESIEFLKSSGTCIDHNIYYYSCKCGEKGEETFEGTSFGNHDYELKEIGEVGHVEVNECKYCHDMECTSLPRIDINTNGSEITEEYIQANISVSRCDDKYLLNNCLADVKIRGNGSAEYDKKPFRIKFSEKQMMLGLNDDLKAKSWVLINEYNDRTRMHNVCAYYISNYLFNHDGLYSTDMRFVEVYINGKYNGLYLLCEQQQVNKARINVYEAPKDYTGVDIGYFIEMDTYYYKEDESQTFAIDYQYNLVYANGKTCKKSKFQNNYTIKSDIYSSEQNEFIKKVIQNIFFIMYDSLNNNHNNGYYTLDDNYDLITDKSIKSSKEAIERVVDLRSYVDMFIIQDLAQNIDIGWSSFFMAFDASEKGSHKLIFEAPWDFDWAMGASYPFKEGLFCVDQDTSGRHTTLTDYVNPWMLMFANVDWFYDLVKDRWQELRQTNAIQDLFKAIDVLAYEYTSYFSSEFAKWPESMTKVLEKSIVCDEYTAHATHFSAVEYLKNYLEQKIAYYDHIWLDE